MAERPAAALLDRGDGEPLLLLHGWGSRKELMLPIAERLPQYRVLAPDLPGMGETPPPPEPWGVDDYAAWVVALLDRLQLPRVSIVGHSNGGRVAIAVAVAAPERVARLVLTASAGIRPRRGVAWHVGVRTYRLLRRVASARWAPAPLRDAARRRAERRGSPDWQASSGVMRGTLVRLVNSDVRHLLPQIRVPVLLVWGDRDAETPLGDARVMESLVADAGLVVFEGAGHFAYAEQPQRFAAVVAAFLSGTAP
ncbi:MAG: alpha/beta fold hydrolase [Candidatus Dormibacteria bacterium]